MLAPEKSPHETHVRLVACPSCGEVLWKPRRGQSYCSGACRAKASRQTHASRMKADLEELRRRVDAMIQGLGKLSKRRG